jgi:hypothetical protein
LTSLYTYDMDINGNIWWGPGGYFSGWLDAVDGMLWLALAWERLS